MSSINHIRRLFALPELARILSLFVSRKDLHQCIRVSKFWYKLFLPRLWESYNPTICKRWREYYKNAMEGKPKDGRNEEWFKAVFNKHAHFIRHLVIWPMFLAKCLGDGQWRDPTSSSRNLKIMSIAFVGIPPSASSKMKPNNVVFLVPQLWGFLCSLKHLKSLDLGFGGSDGDAIIDILQGLILATPLSLSSLNTLKMHIPSIISLQFPPNIEELDIYSMDEAIFLPNSKLRILTLFELSTVSDISDILENFSGLVDLSIMEVVGLSNLNLIKTKCLHAPYHLRRLHLSDFDDFTAVAKVIIPLVPNLIEFAASYFTHELAKCIAENCEFIQKIEAVVPEFNYDRSVDEEREDVLTPLLTSCKNLKDLSAHYNMLDARTALNSPWVCSNLEQLHCRVIGFPYFEEKELETLKQIQEKQKNNETLSDDDDIMAKRWVSMTRLKRKFYKQLSLMKSLRKLTIHSELRMGEMDRPIEEEFYVLSRRYISKRDRNIYYEYDPPSKDSLTMRLEDGLDQLSTLTKLEYLEFEHMDHRMGRKEIKWIAKNFPRLKEVRGLMQGAHLGLEPDAKNKKLYKLLRKLRSDIIHSRRFDTSNIYLRKTH